MNARRYVLNVADVISCGIGTNYSSIKECNILNSFTVNYDTIPSTTCTYPQIDTNDLKSLSKLEYENRVVDYIDSLKLDSEIIKGNLVNISSYVEPECITCGLNPDFLVYKFLTGIRIVNIGVATGIVQYKVYPTTSDPSNFNWKTSPTFLDLNQTQIYVVEIRDFLNNVEVCKVSTIISMSLLVPSTTLPPQDKLIRVKQTGIGNVNNIAYRTGCIEIIPTLQPQEMLNLNYIANLYVNGCGSACVHFTCKPNNCNDFLTHTCLTNENNVSPINESINIRSGDIICYNVTAIGETLGTTSKANYCISSISGLGTINPIIDVGSCSVDVTKQIPPVVTTIGFTGKTLITLPTKQTINGIICFSEAIPNNECVTIQLSGSNYTQGGTSLTAISCKPNNGTSYLNHSLFDSINTQPQLPEIIVCCGDQLCYDITLDTPIAGTSSSASICIGNLSASLGVLPIKDNTISGNLVCSSISIPQISETLSVCRNGSTQYTSDGYINLTPALNNNNQYVSATFDTYQLIGGSGTTGLNQIVMYCKPNNGTSFIELYNFRTLNSNEETLNTGTITFRCGDVVCYNNSISGDFDLLQSSFCFTNVIASTDISPTISTTKCGDILIKN